MMTEKRRAGILGRSMRLLVAVFLVVIDVPVLLEAGWRYNLSSLALTLTLALFYTLLHYVISRHIRNLNRNLGAVLAVTPVFLVWFFGQGGGYLFGSGEGGTAAITYLAVSLLIDVVRADSGCEVMALPGLLFRERTHLACLMFSPIDMMERAGARKSS
jgi:hypothetical protein